MKNYHVSIMRLILITAVMIGSCVNASEKKLGVTAKHRQMKNKVITRFYGVKRKNVLQSKIGVDSSNATPAVTQSDVLHKPLILDVPFNGLESAYTKRQINSVQQTQDVGLFVDSHKQAERSLQVKGDFVMSQEPESGKKKSVDGAAIVINLRP